MTTIPTGGMFEGTKVGILARKGKRETYSLYGAERWLDCACALAAAGVDEIIAGPHKAWPDPADRDVVWWWNRPIAARLGVGGGK